LKLLGIEIVASLDNIDSIFAKIIVKITNLTAYWERFKLSLPGRITVAKTFLVSQLNYVGCFLTPSDNIIERIQVIIDNFVKNPSILPVAESINQWRRVGWECVI
jgi:hypothetical protein